MGFVSDTSDYGSASSLTGSQWWSPGVAAGAAGAAGGGAGRERTLSFGDAAALAEALGAREVAMREFRLNGSDAPFEPEPRAALLRQRSWPAAERAPPRAAWPAPAAPAAWPYPAAPAAPATAWPGAGGAGGAWRQEAPAWPETTPDADAGWLEPTARAARAALATLRALPPDTLALLLGDLRRRVRKPQYEGCRFCKNNGEREAVYGSHSLRDGSGRVTCPVLRAYVCKRCGAREDRAHTIKYCPFSSDEERRQSDAMMRSVRMASGRRRAPPRAPRWDPAVAPAPPVTPAAAPLDPVWAALEEKLSAMQ